MTTTSISTSFCDRLRQAAWPIWEQQLQHPFVRALGDGTLPPDTFQFYIRQDARYLDDFAKCYAYAIAKTADHGEIQRFGDGILRVLEVERGIHQRYAGRFGVSAEEMKATPMAPTTFAYTRHMLYVSATGSKAALLAAILPCAWVYAEVGRHFGRLLGGEPPQDHPYAEWIRTYSSPEFEEVGAWLRQLLEEEAAGLPERELARLEEIFLTSSRYEYMFWDMAQKQDQWPV
ncbi:MAG: thiaminase II [Dehalococcoidia bacterium]